MYFINNCAVAGFFREARGGKSPPPPPCLILYFAPPRNFNEVTNMNTSKAIICKIFYLKKVSLDRCHDDRLLR